MENFVLTSDSCVVQATKAATNCADVAIAKWVVMAIVIIVGMCVVGILCLQLMNHISKCCAEKRKRKWEIEDRNQKQYAELLTKKLECLNSQKNKNITTYLSELEKRMDIASNK